jgi:hypothetical protein
MAIGRPLDDRGLAEIIHVLAVGKTACGGLDSDPRQGGQQGASCRWLDRMIQTPADTKVGRAAKVRVLLVHVMPCSKDHGVWRGPSDDLDYDIRMCRLLLADLAGMTETEIADV